jgi:ribonuclease VapC
VNKIVLDASVLLAIIYKEKGWEKMNSDLLARAAVSTVNLAEVQGKLMTDGWTSEEAWEDATSPIGEVCPFTTVQAKTAGSLIVQTRVLGLSLGDRACLALALELKAPVYTADRAWKSLSLPVRVHPIR